MEDPINVGFTTKMLQFGMIWEGTPLSETLMDNHLYTYAYTYIYILQYTTDDIYTRYDL